MVTIRERSPYNFFHNTRCPSSIEFSKRLVVSFPIDEFDIHRNKSFPDEKIIVDNTADSAVSIDERMGVLKGEMKLRDSFDDIFMAHCLVFNEHLIQSGNNLSRRWGDMVRYPNIFVVLTESSGDIVPDI